MQQSFNQERNQLKSLVEKIAAEKVTEAEEDFFANTAQHEQGLSKLEVHVLNQRKRLALLKGSLDVANSDKELLE
jgi:hypothetical protein